MSKEILLVIPEAPQRQSAQPGTQRVLSADGIRLGILDNSKSNADHLLGFIVEGLQGVMRVTSVVKARKPSASLPAIAEVMERFIQETDCVVSAMAD